MLETAYNNRWIDFAQNKGKETGAYCASPYFTHYVFISWTGKMAETFVLAHELGHAGHFKLAQDHQNLLESEASMYFVEAPSTMNEMLMANYLFNSSNDPQIQTLGDWFNSIKNLLPQYGNAFIRSCIST